jgi:hypothetical protein
VRFACSISSRFCVAKQTAPTLSWIERGRRLVEQEHARLAEERNGNVQALSVADGELARRPRAGRKREAFEHLRRLAARVADAFELREQLEVLTR